MQELKDKKQAEENKKEKKQKKKGRRNVDVDDGGAVCRAACGAADVHAAGAAGKEEADATAQHAMMREDACWACQRRQRMLEAGKLQWTQLGRAKRSGWEMCMRAGHCRVFHCQGLGGGGGSRARSSSAQCRDGKVISRTWSWQRVSARHSRDVLTVSRQILGGGL